MVVSGTIRLELGSAGTDLITDLSAVCREGPWLWLAGDESVSVERLRQSEPAGDLLFSTRRSFALSELIELPGGPAQEVDIEGMDRQGGYLWLTGSHSRARRRGDPDDDDDKIVERLGEVRDAPNRHVIMRLPITVGVDGPAPVRVTSSPSGEPLAAAALVGGLTAHLREDRHLGMFVSVPSKDNGLDVEGLVALDDGHVLVGLRGPVLRGWAVVLDLVMAEDALQSQRLVLESCRLVFLDLDGLGVRDLCKAGDDILVLAGPTMDLDGPVWIYRWKDAATTRGVVVRREAFAGRTEVPYGVGEDHAEGITLLGPASDEVLTVYDSPSKVRLSLPGSILADRISLRQAAADTSSSFTDDGAPDSATGSPGWRQP